MDIVSLLITLAGSLVIVGLYLLSRINQTKINQHQDRVIPEIRDSHGQLKSSILEDFPAQDGSTPKLPVSHHSVEVQTVKKTTQKNANPKNRQSRANPKEPEVLFIAAQNGQQLDGKLIQKVMREQQLMLGEMDIYHYMIEIDGIRTSLFRIANGVKPWTLRPQDLDNQSTPGLSMILPVHTNFKRQQAVEIFIDTAQTLSKKLDAVVKNKHHSIFTQQDKQKMLAID